MGDLRRKKLRLIIRIANFAWSILLRAFSFNEHFMATFPVSDDLDTKIAVGLERIADAVKSLLWEKAKQFGLSPIQIQILEFIARHDLALCNVSHLAREFNLTKPTVSDAVRVLHQKKLIGKDFSPADSRRYTITLTAKGGSMLAEIGDYRAALHQSLKPIADNQKATLFTALAQLIYQLNRSGILQVQRTCFGCRYYQPDGQQHYCRLLQKPLLDDDIRLDCPEYEAKTELPH